MGTDNNSRHAEHLRQLGEQNTAFDRIVTYNVIMPVYIRKYEVNLPKLAETLRGGIAGTLDANYYKGCGVREGIEREFVAVKRNDGNSKECK